MPGTRIHRKNSRCTAAIERDAAQWLSAAAAAHAAGQWERARALCLRILERNPRHADALHLLALEEHSAGRHLQAIAILRRALAVAPSNAAFHANLAAILHSAGDLTGALAAARQALAFDPALPGAHNHLGLILLDESNFAEAEAAFRRALALDTHSAAILTNLALAVERQSRYDEAEALFRKAIALAPNLAEAHDGLGRTLFHLKRLGEAVEVLNRALALVPDLAQASAALAVALMDLGRPAEAIPHAERAVALDPHHAEFRWNLAFLELQLGDFAQGWRNFEVRRELAAVAPRPRSEPLWLGEPLAGERILLHAEQGLGDSIQFLRYAPLVAAAGGAVVLDLPRKLHRLAASLPGVVEITAGFRLSAPCQWQCPLMSLPLAFGTRLDTIPARVPYLVPSAEARAQAKALLWPEKGLRVGLVWAGNTKHIHDKLRSVSLAQFAPILSLEGAHFFSLQLDADPAELTHYGIHDLAPTSGNMDDTAARIEQLDLLVTVDTAVAHLAGALGHPCWMLDRYAADFRWLVGRVDSPWYPTLTIYRQPERHDWPTVIARLRSDLETHICASPKF